MALPDEVVRAIFIFACKKAVATSSTTWTEVTLSGVCRRWRAIALDCPTLWSVIRDEGICSIRRLEIYLERSRCAPLHVFLNLAEVCSSEFSALVVRTLRPCVERLHRLHLSLPDSGVCPKLFHGLQVSKLPALQTVELLADDIEDTYDLERDDEGLTGRPSLNPTSLRIDTRSMATLSLHTNTVRTLQIEGGSSYHTFTSQSLLVALASRSADLTYLTIGSGVINDALPPARRLFKEDDDLDILLRIAETTFLLPNLTHFRCADQGAVRFIGLFATAPRLEVLVLKNITLSDIYLPQGKALVSPVLHTLGLIGCPASSHGAVSFAEKTRHIRHLYVFHSTSKKGPFDEMAYQLPEQVLWPCLGTMTFDLAKLREDPLQFVSLVDMMEERLRTLGRRKPIPKPLVKVFGKDAEAWRAASRAGWTRLAAVASVRCLPEGCRNTSIPWPPRDDNVFAFGSEKEFQL